MKTTKKRLVLSIAGAALLCVGAVFTTLAATAEPQITDETMLANIEALSNDEGGSSTDWKCWSSLRDGSGPTWLCGNPCEKYENKAPDGGRGTCNAN